MTGPAAPAWVVELEDRIRELDRVISEAQGTPAVEAWIERGDAQRELLDHLGALESYERAVALSEPGEELHTLALALTAAELVRLKRHEEGLTQARSVVADGVTSTLRRARAESRRAQVSGLLGLDRPGEARAVCAEIIEDFGADPRQGPKGTDVVLQAHAMRARALAVEGLAAESEAEYDRLLDAADAEEPGATRVVVPAQGQRAITWARTGRAAEAAELQRRLLDDYGDSEDPNVRATAVASGMALCGLLLKDEQPEAVLQVIARIRGIRDLLGPYDRPLIEYNLALSAAPAHVRLEATDSAEATLRELLARPELLACARRPGPLVRVVSDSVDQLIAAEQLRRANMLVDDALARLQAIATGSKDLLRLWSRKLTLAKRDKTPATALAACDEIIVSIGDPDTEQGRVVVVNSYTEKANRLISLRRNRAARRVCQEAISRFATAPEVSVRGLVTGLKTVKAELELERHRPREAVRLYQEMCDFHDQNPESPVAGLADRARSRLQVIDNDRRDRRRVLIAAAAVPAVLAAPAALGAFRAWRASSGRRGLGPRPRSADRPQRVEGTAHERANRPD